MGHWSTPRQALFSCQVTLWDLTARGAVMTPGDMCQNFTCFGGHTWKVSSWHLLHQFRSHNLFWSLGPAFHSPGDTCESPESRTHTSLKLPWFLSAKSRTVIIPCYQCRENIFYFSSDGKYFLRCKGLTSSQHRQWYFVTNKSFVNTTDWVLLLNLEATGGDKPSFLVQAHALLFWTLLTHICNHTLCLPLLLIGCWEVNTVMKLEAS